MKFHYWRITYFLHYYTIIFLLLLFPTKMTTVNHLSPFSSIIICSIIYICSWKFVKCNFLDKKEKYVLSKNCVVVQENWMYQGALNIELYENQANNQKFTDVICRLLQVSKIKIKRFSRKFLIHQSFLIPYSGYLENSAWRPTEIHLNIDIFTGSPEDFWKSG